MAQELATIVAMEEDSGTLDLQCPECQALLTIRYGEHDQPRYLCENCEQELSAREIESANYGDGYDVNIYIVSSNNSNRRFF